MALACVKTLQCPRETGPGVAFEPAPLLPGIEEQIRELLHGCGFHPVFDAEFVLEGERPLLIDLNPRFYNPMAFEIERGAAPAWMAYLASIGDRQGVVREAALAGARLQRNRVYASGCVTDPLMPGPVRIRARAVSPMGNATVHRSMSMPRC